MRALLLVAILTARHPYPADRPAPVGERIVKEVFPPELWKWALDVAWCESTMKGDARNGRFRGMYQLGPREWRAHRPRPDANIFDRRDNALAALSLYRSRGAKPWVCR